MKKIYQLVVCISGLLLAFCMIPNAMAQPDPRMDSPRFDNTRLDKDAPHILPDPKLRKDHDKEDEIKPELPKPKAAAPGIKPMYDHNPGVGEPVPPNHVKRPDGPDRIKPDPDHPVKVHVSGKKPAQKVRHASVMKKGAISAKNASHIDDGKLHECMENCSKKVVPGGRNMRKEECHAYCNPDKK